MLDRERLPRVAAAYQPAGKRREAGGIISLGDRNTLMPNPFSGEEEDRKCTPDNYNLHTVKLNKYH